MHDVIKTQGFEVIEVQPRHNKGTATSQQNGLAKTPHGQCHKHAEKTTYFENASCAQNIRKSRRGNGVY